MTGGCRQAAKEYPLKGQIVGIDKDSRQLTVKHEDIEGFMPGMVMSFDVADPAQIDERATGELITATLVVQDFEAMLKDIKVTGRAPVDTASRQAATPHLEPGQPVPDAEFVDQDGRRRRFSEWRGRRVLVTFIYTRCPLPDFCPRIERNLRDVQELVRREASLRDRVSLVAVTFDPRHDTPPVLKERARAIGADTSVWTYLTGEVETIEEFAARFGVAIIRNPENAADITHNLRTAVIADDGTLVQVLNGSDWTAQDALSALDPARASTN
jgi:protein SCO1/2